jgi:hypothetical protein
VSAPRTRVAVSLARLGTLAGTLSFSHSTSHLRGPKESLKNDGRPPGTHPPPRRFTHLRTILFISSRLPIPSPTRIPIHYSFPIDKRLWIMCRLILYVFRVSGLGFEALV